jgi:hypothetical protein
VVAYFKTLAQYVPGGNDDIHENPVMIGASLGRDSKSQLTAYGLIHIAVR